MSEKLAAHRGSRKGLRPLVLPTMLSIAGVAAAPPLQAQPSPSCQFAVTAYVGTQVELESAKTAHRRCKKESLSACQVELARMKDLQRRLKLARDYIDRYCTR